MSTPSNQPMPHLPREVRLQIIAELLYSELVSDVRSAEYGFFVHQPFRITDTLRTVHRLGMTLDREIIDDVSSVARRLPLEFELRYIFEDDDVPGELFTFNRDASSISVRDWQSIGLELYHLSFGQLCKLVGLLGPLPPNWAPSIQSTTPTAQGVASELQQPVIMEPPFAIRESENNMSFGDFSSLREAIGLKYTESVFEKVGAVQHVRAVIPVALMMLEWIRHSVDNMVDARV